VVVTKKHSGGSKRLPQVKKYLYFSDKPEFNTVNAAPLDDVLSGLRFDVILLDIEGSEFFALKGMQRLLGEAKALCVEYLPHHLKNVAGVTPTEFVAQVEPHFEKLLVPGTGRTAVKAGFAQLLQEMYDHDAGDDGVIFTKT
jgi:hypothetical protein